jgi:exodeoxyribonuclease V gamma subunit
MQCVYSRLAAKHRLAAWVRFLAVTAAAPEAGYRAVSVGRGQAKRFQLCTSVLQAPGTDPTASSAWAHRRLAELVDLYQRGMREPLPLACDTSWAWTKARRAGDDEAGCRRAAGEKWDSSAGFGGEAAQPDHVEVFGPNPPFSRLLEARPRADEAGPGWPDGPSRFEVLARRLWDPLADVEELTES